MVKKLIQYVLIGVLLFGALSMQGANSIPKNRRYILTSQVIAGLIICASSPVSAWYESQKIHDLKAIVRKNLYTTDAEGRSIEDPEMKRVYRYFADYFPSSSSLSLFFTGFGLVIDGLKKLGKIR